MNRDQIVDVLANATDPGSENHERAVSERKKWKARADLAEVFFAHRLAEPVAAVLNAQDELSAEAGFIVHRDNGWSGFDGDTVASALVSRVRAGQSPAEAVQWLERVLQTTKAEGLCVLATWGVSLRDKIAFDNGVDVLPFEDLPDSPFKSLVLRDRDLATMASLVPLPFLRPPEAALTLRVTMDPAISNRRYGNPPVRDDAGREYTLLSEVLLALTPIGPCAAMPAGYWFQYTDPDLTDALFLVGWTLPTPDILPAVFPKPHPLDPEETKRIVSAYLRLEPGLRRRAQVALQRLNQAIRRLRFGDKAAEISIALEALLIDEPGEHNHKVGLRAALLLGGDSETRIRHRSIIGGLYKARSALMHGGQESDEINLKVIGKLPRETIADEGIRICAAVIRRTIELGSIPDWYKIELGVEGS